jgi:hypothetical protein
LWKPLSWKLLLLLLLLLNPHTGAGFLLEGTAHLLRSMLSWALVVLHSLHAFVLPVQNVLQRLCRMLLLVRAKRVLLQLDWRRVATPPLHLP